MTKREKIREVINEFLNEYDEDGNPAVDWAFILLHRLAKKGVVIKVRCPHCAWAEFKELEVVGMTPCEHCNSIGYIYEPLVGE